MVDILFKIAPIVVGFQERVWEAIQQFGHFKPVKTMPAGDGGMITTNDKLLADKCREMSWFGVSSTWSRSHGKSASNLATLGDYEAVNILGYKY